MNGVEFAPHGGIVGLHPRQSTEQDADHGDTWCAPCPGGWNGGRRGQVAREVNQRDFKAGVEEENI